MGLFDFLKKRFGKGGEGPDDRDKPTDRTARIPRGPDGTADLPDVNVVKMKLRSFFRKRMTPGRLALMRHEVACMGPRQRGIAHMLVERHMGAYPAPRRSAGYRAGRKRRRMQRAAELYGSGA